ncbi:MAG: metal-dependent hydrolase, partial [Pseudomonas alloputida]
MARIGIRYAECSAMTVLRYLQA